MLTWDEPGERYFQHGVDRGVLYPSGGDPVPWNGITGIDEAGNGTSSVYYIDGRVYLADVDPSDFDGKLMAYFWPEEFSVCVGIPETTPGLYVDNQKPKRFNLAYRSLIGSGLEGDMFGYQIHLLYNAMAMIGARSRKTLNNTPAPMEFTFDIVATPVKLPGFRPSAHYIIDTRNLDAAVVQNLEDILYGDSEGSIGALPTPAELYDLLSFGSAITFTDHGDGTWTAHGSAANVHMTGPGTWEILNVNGVDHGDGTFTLSDTP